MHQFVIESVVKARPWVNGIDAYLDDPAAKTFALPRYGLSLRGWVVCATERVASLRLVWHGRRIADAKISARADVEAVYPGNRHVVGFRIDAVPAVLGNGEPLKIVLDTVDGRSSTLFEITLRFVVLPEFAELARSTTTFAPILALPRTGTTFLSGLLHRHSQVLGHGEYPYEARFGVGLAEEWFANMQPCFYESDGSRNSPMMDQNMLAMLTILDDGNPGMNPQLARFFEALRGHYRERIVGLYTILSPHALASAIVEKVGFHWHLALLSSLFERVRPIFIVRDPRDMLVSMREFNERRGVYDFHEAQGKNISAIVASITASLMQQVSLYDGYPGEKMLIRYEDLVCDSATTLRQTLDFIGIDSAPGKIEKLLKQADSNTAHITASSPASSIGRWREILTRSEAQMTNWFFEPFLRRYGYAD